MHRVCKLDSHQIGCPYVPISLDFTSRDIECLLLLRDMYTGLFVIGECFVGIYYGRSSKARAP